MATVKLVGLVFACIAVALALGAEGDERRDTHGLNSSLEIEHALAALQALLTNNLGNDSTERSADKPGDKTVNTSDVPIAQWPQLAEAQLVRLTAALHHQVEETKKAVVSALHQAQQQVAASAEQFRASHPELEQHLQAALSRAADVSAALSRAMEALSPGPQEGAPTETSRGGTPAAVAGAGHGAHR